MFKCGGIFAVLAIAGVSAPVAAQEVADVMQYADTNGDGKVTLEEYAALMEQAWGYFAQGAETVKVADLPPLAKGAFAGVKPDDNGMVTHKAFTESVAARFKAADKNGDGTLSAAELNGAMLVQSGGG